MRHLTASIPHQLSRAEVKRRIEDLVERLRNQRGAFLENIQETWTGDAMRFSLSAVGQQLSGDLAVDDHAVHVNVALPWFFSMLAGTVKQAIEQRGHQLLGNQPEHNQEGELLGPRARAEKQDRPPGTP
jgi:putative polyhydroxyalkanoate system protein